MRIAERSDDAHDVQNRRTIDRRCSLIYASSLIYIAYQCCIPVFRTALIYIVSDRLVPSSDLLFECQGCPAFIFVGSVCHVPSTAHHSLIVNNELPLRGSGLRDHSVDIVSVDKNQYE